MDFEYIKPNVPVNKAECPHAARRQISGCPDHNTTPTCGFLIASSGKEEELSIWD
jgi:hypothetical protein